MFQQDVDEGENEFNGVSLLLQVTAQWLHLLPRLLWRSRASFYMLAPVPQNGAEDL